MVDNASNFDRQSRPSVTPETYPQLTVPHGHLPNDIRAQACWFYYTIAQSAKELVGDSTDDQIILEGSRWRDKHYENQARSVAMLYGIESPAEMFKFWKYVVAEARDLGLPAPSQEYMNPQIGRIIV